MTDRRPVMDRVVKQDDGCWIWDRAIDPQTGYGKVRIANRTWNAHRYAYQLHYGGVPEGHVVDHICRVRACINPDHLRAVTQIQNMHNHSGPTAANTSGYRGVSWDSRNNRWSAAVKCNGKKYWLGRFSDRHAAAAAVLAARRELWTHNEIDRVGV